MIRVLMADDHAVMRRGIREILEADDEIEVIGEACDGREAIRLAEKLKPNVMILDLGMPELNGLDAIRHMRRELPEIELLAFSMHDSEELIREVFAAGARGYVLKSDSAVYLTEGVKSLFRIVQESLTNIRRHTNSETAEITVKQMRKRVRLSIRDEGSDLKLSLPRNGDGFESIGVGIPGMRHRLKQLGGELFVDSNSNGTTVTATVPVRWNGHD